MDSLIQVMELVKVYHLGEVEVRALRGVSVSIDRGEFVAIMGASGSGKSTFMNILGFLDQPTSGRYLLEGRGGENLSRDELAEIRNQKIGFVFQGFNLLARTSALENIELPLIYSKTPTLRRKELTRKALSSVGLEGRGHHHTGQLSGGEQQRVAIARAIVNDPLLLLADEPTGNIDPGSAEEIIKLFDMINFRGTTVMLATHNNGLPLMLPKERIVLERGRMVETSLPKPPAGD